MRHILVLLALTLLVASCASPSPGPSTADLQAKLDAQATEIAQLKAVQATPAALVVTTEAAPAQPAPTATRVPPREDRSLFGQLRYVSAGGLGVRIRSECSQEAAGLGAWPDGVAVGLEYAREDCPGWYRVVAGDKAGWVRAEYLSQVAPTPVPTAVPPAPTAVPPPPAPAYEPPYTYFGLTVGIGGRYKFPLRLYAGNTLEANFSIGQGKDLKFWIEGPWENTVYYPGQVLGGHTFSYTATETGVYRLVWDNCLLCTGRAVALNYRIR